MRGTTASYPSYERSGVVWDHSEGTSIGRGFAWPMDRNCSHSLCSCIDSWDSSRSLYSWHKHHSYWSFWLNQLLEYWTEAHLAIDPCFSPVPTDLSCPPRRSCHPTRRRIQGRPNCVPLLILHTLLGLQQLLLLVLHLLLLSSGGPAAPAEILLRSLICRLFLKFQSISKQVLLEFGAIFKQI